MTTRVHYQGGSLSGQIVPFNNHSGRTVVGHETYFYQLATGKRQGVTCYLFVHQAISLGRIDFIQGRTAAL